MPIPTALTQQQFNTRWHSLRRPSQLQAPLQWRRWLTDPGSLTQRLISKSKGDFRVEVIRQQWDLPTRSELRALGMRNRERALVREVQLIGCGTPWVYARSIIPASTLTGRQRILAQLGTTPLGQLMFRDPTMRRGPLQIAQLKLADNGHAWARRSLFYLAGKPLLVCEVFLPELLRVE
ncbi:chorismate--pyruvate lyase family protein [Marinobacterium arenosum]|uniref:chorismate--pyruvate lyase family protein n=1 Tax=Marinobacterium arenosum TaxID=2862496 RepID=UPI001C974DCD|nr:chorismate lyase [Marinobacterium arenosum]MBY4676535.1 chorismate lyase [Marinobacterium arenosum]